MPDFEVKVNLILPGLVLVFIGLVAYIGYGFGAMHVCKDLDGFLDSEFKCHLDYDPEVSRNDRLNRAIGIPEELEVQFNLSKGGINGT